MVSCRISLLSLVNKLYSSVLNKRLLNYLESEDMLVDEQIGFRPDRSCEGISGDSISPTLFAFFINDLAEGLKRLHKDVNFNNHEICCLLYAADIMLMSENEEYLQIMLDFVHQWCDKRRLRINYAKSNVMHF